MKRIGRLNLRDLSGKRLQRPEMKFLVGGCGGYGGYGGGDDGGGGSGGDGYSGDDDTITCTIEWLDGTSETSTCIAGTVKECNDACKIAYPLDEPTCICS
jgi:hypothetical protein